MKSCDEACCFVLLCICCFPHQQSIPVHPSHCYCSTKSRRGRGLKQQSKKLLKHPHGFLVMLSNVIVTPNTCWKHDRHYKLLWKWCGQADKIILSDNYPVLCTLTKIFSASFFDIE